MKRKLNVVSTKSARNLVNNTVAKKYQLSLILAASLLCINVASADECGVCSFTAPNPQFAEAFNDQAGQTVKKIIISDALTAYTNSWISNKSAQDHIRKLRDDQEIAETEAKADLNPKSQTEVEKVEEQKALLAKKYENALAEQIKAETAEKEAYNKWQTAKSSKVPLVEECDKKNRCAFFWTLTNREKSYEGKNDSAVKISEALIETNIGNSFTQQEDKVLTDAMFDKFAIEITRPKERNEHGKSLATSEISEASIYLNEEIAEMRCFTGGNRIELKKNMPVKEPKYNNIGAAGVFGGGYCPAK